jgi:hypothetical protein
MDGDATQGDKDIEDHGPDGDGQDHAGQAAWN